jgi:hypothetical protein
MLLDRPIPKALFYSHVRLEAKRNALDARLASVPTELLRRLQPKIRGVAAMQSFPVRFRQSASRVDQPLRAAPGACACALRCFTGYFSSHLVTTK